MSDLLIRNVDEGLIGALSARAAATGATLDATATALLRSALAGESGAGRSSREILQIAKDTRASDSTFLIRRDRDGVSANEMPADEVVRSLRDLRGQALRPILSDSTPHIREDRDA